MMIIFGMVFITRTITPFSIFSAMGPTSLLTNQFTFFMFKTRILEGKPFQINFHFRQMAEWFWSMMGESDHLEELFNVPTWLALSCRKKYLAYHFALELYQYCHIALEVLWRIVVIVSFCTKVQIFTQGLLIQCLGSITALLGRSSGKAAWR